MARFKLDTRAFDAEVLCSGFMQSEMLSRAAAIQARAEALAPVGTPPDDKHPGLYKSSFNHFVVVKHTGQRPGERAVGVVENTADYAGVVEYGDGLNVGHAPLRRALYGG